MIRSVGSATKESFKRVEFKSGLNVILADRADTSTDKDTRNGVGKTLLIDIIHFCLGGSFDKHGPLTRLADGETSFYVEIDVQDVSLTISRQVGQDTPVAVGGLPEEWLAGLDAQHGTDGYVTIKAAALNHFLGQKWFGLGPHEKYGPTFRRLIAFFARNDKGAFLDPFESFSKMPAADKQVLNAFLLNLGWEYAVKWHHWKDQSELFKSSKKAIESWYLPGSGTVGEMESELLRVKTQQARSKSELDNFQVSDQYDELKRRVNRITREMQSRQNENVSDGELLRMYHSHLATEEDTEPENLIRLYEEAGAFLAESVKRRLEEVRAFHRDLVENRRRFLQAEIDNIERRIAERVTINKAADQEKSKLMATLSTSGALEEFISLQALNAELEGKAAVLQDRIDRLNDLNQFKTKIDEERIALEKATLNDHIDRRPMRDEAMGIFDEYVQRLYECKGDLIIEAKAQVAGSDGRGFAFGSKIDRDDAEGIAKMKIFCYDLLLSRLWSQRNLGPRFLIHDTTLFDGVEERQKGHALELAMSEAEACGFQYICCFNSDMLPDERYLGTVDLRKHIILRLDDTETGNLMGYRF